MESGAYQSYNRERKASAQWRSLATTEILPEGKARRGDRSYLNFSSNDYLGLSHHPALIERACAWTKLHGTGSTASRLITGSAPFIEGIETKLARGKGTESALVMNSGYQANLTVLEALADPAVLGRPVVVFADRLCHHSLLQGALLSGARLIRFHHNDYAHLGSLLEHHAKNNKQLIIMSESVFGMDGDKADLQALISLAEIYEALLYIDEAHATGLYGENGFGLCAAYPGRIDVVMGTFGKALGSFGAYVASNDIIRQYLIQRCGGFIYSTALPPGTAGAIDAALDLLPALQAERDHVAAMALRVRVALQRQGWNCGESTTQIIPIILGGAELASSLASGLLDEGLLVAAIRPPTVPRGTSRLRLSLSAAHTDADIDRVIDVMEKARPRYCEAA